MQDEPDSGSRLRVHKLSQADLVLGCDGIRSAVRTALRTAGADVEQKRFAVPWTPFGCWNVRIVVDMAEFINAASLRKCQVH